MMTAKKKQRAVEPQDAVVDDSDVGEVQLSEYLMLLFAVDVFARHVEDTTLLPANDAHTVKGIRLLQQADVRYADAIKSHIIEKLPNEATQAMVARTFRVRLSNEVQVGRRVISLRTALNRSSAILKAVFEESRPRNAVKASMAASMTEDAAPALARFESLPVRNTRIKTWIRRASELVGSGEVIHNPVQSASAAALDHVETLKNDKVSEESTTGAAEVKALQDARAQTLQKVQDEATEAARTALEVSGKEDRPLTHSEVIGVATAVAAAQAADITHSVNVPASLKTLDAEQQAAALTDGKVLVAAGAGAGKSTTLVARIKYLVEERGVPPEKIIAMSFNRKAGKELEAKVTKALGPEKAKRMQVGTLHSLFRKSITKYGTPLEKMMFEGSDGLLKGDTIATTVNQIWRKCYAKWDAEREEFKDAEAPSAKQMMLHKTKFLSNGISPAQAKEAAVSAQDQQIARWYEMYEALKGRVPWGQEDCSDARGVRAIQNNFVRKHRTVQDGDVEKVRKLGDFDDMIRVFADILERSPEIRKRAQKAFQHVMVDECVHESTEVVLKGGARTTVALLKVGDEVLSYENGSATFKRVADKRRSSQTKGRAVLFSSGREITATDNHRFYATEFTNDLIPEGCLGLYLMFRSDLGFRIGTSRSLMREPNRMGRAASERADCFWLLEVAEADEILYLEQALSLEYGVPTYMYEASIRGCDQDRVDRIFGRFGENGRTLLDAYGLEFEYPLWTNTSSTRGKRPRVVLTVAAHAAHWGTGVKASWSGEVPGGDKLATCTVTGGRHQFTSRSLNYAEQRRKAFQASNATGWRIREVLSFQGHCLPLVTTSALRIGMKVPAWEGGWINFRQNKSDSHGELRSLAARMELSVGTADRDLESLYEAVRAEQIRRGLPPLPPVDESKFVMDTIMDIEPATGVFYDLTIEDTGNFFGNGVLTHNCQDLNPEQYRALKYLTEHVTDGKDGSSFWMVGDPDQSIYAFRGARPELFVGLDGAEGWKTRLIRTNYRCPPEVVDCANKLIAHNTQRMEKDALPAPTKPRGEASIEASVYRDEAETALTIASEIEARWAHGKGVAAEDNAVLCATNSELDAYELALLTKGIPYARKGATSFLSSPETKAFLGYMSLVTDADGMKSQEALAAILNKPNRFFVNDEKKLKQAVKFAVNNYAKRKNVTISEVDAVVAMRDVGFQRDIIKGLDKTSSRSAPRLMEELSEQLNHLSTLAQDEKTTTQELFNAILEVPGLELEVDPDNDRRMIEKTVSFRESLMRFKQDAVGGDIEDESESDEGDDLDAPVGVGPAAGLGTISFLYELSNTDPNDEMDSALPPDKPKGFWAKMERLKERAGDLRYDLNKWKGEDPPPGVYLGTVHCSPADEPVLTTEGWVPIGSLDPDKHRLASYTHTCNQLFWGQVKGEHDGIAGYGFVKAVNRYEGPLLTLTTPKSRTRVTPDHRIRVKWSESFFNKYVVYLMRRGDWWRVGLAKSGNRPYGGSDFKQRVSAEKADACWILSVHSTRVEAALEEARVQGRYGITGLTFEASSHRRTSSEQLQAIHESIKSATGERVLRLLSDYGFDKRHPLYVGQGRDMDMRSAFDIQARNCLSGYMVLPVASEAFIECSGPREVWTKPEWHEVSVSREPFVGDVYSLVVLPHRYYVSGGAVVHNSVKGAQWPYVTVQMTEGRFPMPTRHDTEVDELTPEMQAQEDVDLEGYRRLAYVALTRPSKELRVVAPEKYNGKRAGMSRFLAEAGLTLGENVKPVPIEGGAKTAKFFIEDAGAF